MTYTFSDDGIFASCEGFRRLIVERPISMKLGAWIIRAANIIRELGRLESVDTPLVKDKEPLSMKLVDILARELKVWPEGVSCLSQLQHNGAIINGKGYDGREWARLQIAEDTPPAGVLVTEAGWQAAVDALKADRVAYSPAMHIQRAGRVTRKDSPKADAQTDDTPSLAQLIGRGWLAPIFQIDEIGISNWPRRVYSFDLPPSLRDLDANLVVDPKPKDEPKTVEWDGEGLPPVGVECDVLGDVDGGYTSVHILMHDGSRAVFRYTAGKNIGDHDSACADVIFGRPIFRPIKTAEQLAAEQRAKAVGEMVDTLKLFNSIHEACGILYDAGYIKP